ncbi:hypothetical protein IWW48_004447 [Coemansia sp. RSA 1200]|nr:hypothetical protein IWW48_004447 [Coemansia sp. RSA 1200]
MAGFSKSISDRIRDEPLVPLGIAATIGAFVFASWGLYRNNARNMQLGMRGRVVMQGLTIGALAWYGLYATSNDTTTKERRTDIRPIDWERVEREAEAAEKAGKDLLTGAKKNPSSVFANEAETKK